MNNITIQKIRSWMGEYLPDTEEHGYTELEKILLSADEAKEKPTAPASLVEELTEFSYHISCENETGKKIRAILSRYRPSTQADIVGELKELLRDGSSQPEDGENWRKWLGKIIAKHEGAK